MSKTLILLTLIFSCFGVSSTFEVDKKYCTQQCRAELIYKNVDLNEVVLICDMSLKYKKCCSSHAYYGFYKVCN